MPIVFLGEVKNTLLFRLISQRDYIFQDISEHEFDRRLMESTILITSEIEVLLSERSKLWEKLTDKKLVLIGCEDGFQRRSIEASANLHRVSLTFVASQNGISEEALMLLEEVSVRKILQQRGYNELLQRGAQSCTRNKPTIALVGAGIVNLILAWHLIEDGYTPFIFDRSSDPRKGFENWLGFGSTFGGGNARMYTFNEARNHDLRFVSVNNNVQLAGNLSSTVKEGGWLDERVLDSDELEWINQYQNIEKWLLGIHDNDIISVNKASAPLWEKMRIRDPEIFSDCTYSKNILRTYSRNDQYVSALQKEDAIGALKRVISLERLRKEQPILENAIKDQHIVGALEVQGFSLEVKNFGLNLLRAIERRGAQFLFDAEISQIQANPDRRISIIVNGTTSEYDYVVVSPGAYGGQISEGMSTHNKIHSVAGIWKRLKNDGHPLSMSMKYVRSGPYADGPAEGANIIYSDMGDGQDIWISSGHCYVGKSPNTISRSSLLALERAVDDTASKLFPGLKRHASDDLNDIQYCIRPWAAGCLGIFDIRPTKSGALVTSGGQNTGGFSQAPAMAKAFIDLLHGQENPIHWKYSLERIGALSSI